MMTADVETLTASAETTRHDNTTNGTERENGIHSWADEDDSSLIVQGAPTRDRGDDNDEEEEASFHSAGEETMDDISSLIMTHSTTPLFSSAHSFAAPRDDDGMGKEEEKKVEEKERGVGEGEGTLKRPPSTWSLLPADGNETETTAPAVETTAPAVKATVEENEEEEKEEDEAQEKEEQEKEKEEQDEAQEEDDEEKKENDEEEKEDDERDEFDEVPPFDKAALVLPEPDSDDELDDDATKVDSASVVAASQRREAAAAAVALRLDEDVVPTEKRRQEEKKDAVDKDGWERPTVHSMGLNQDRSCISMATSLGYHIRTLTWHEACDEQQQELVCRIPRGGVKLCLVLFGTCLVAVVKVSEPRCLMLMNARSGAVLQNLFFVTAISRVEWNRASLVVLTHNGRLHVFDLPTLQMVKVLGAVHFGPQSVRAAVASSPQASLPGAFFDLSRHEFESYLVVRGRGWNDDDDDDALEENGGGGKQKAASTAAAAAAAAEQQKKPSLVGSTVIRVLDSTDMRLLTNIRIPGVSVVKNSKGAFKTTTAAGGGVSRMCIGGNRAHQRLALASEKGTMIRIYSLPHCEQLYALWRGSSSCFFYSMSFNESADHLAVSSSTGTIHVFNLWHSSTTTVENGGGGGEATSAPTTPTATMTTTSTGTTTTASAVPASNTSAATTMTFWNFRFAAQKVIKAVSRPEEVLIRSYAKIRFLPPSEAGSNFHFVALAKQQEQRHLVVVAHVGGWLQYFQVGADGQVTTKRRLDLLHALK